MAAIRSPANSYSFVATRTAEWFAEMFWKSLVMEHGYTLWPARATPRAYLEQGKKISVKNAPTCSASAAYEISDVDNDKITATVEMLSRNSPKEIVLRFRHPGPRRSRSSRSTASRGPSITRVRRPSPSKAWPAPWP